MKYTVGADFGTLSVRAVLAETATGKEILSVERKYPHGVMTRFLPDGTALPPDHALQIPEDYYSCLGDAVRTLMRDSGVKKEDVIGLGLDCTADTSLFVDEQNRPMCAQERFSACPSAYVRMWKHHGAEQEARDIRKAAEKSAPELLECYGGRVFSEWMLPKLLESCRRAPDLVECADRYVQIGDWLVSCLTGSTARSASHAGFKNFRTEKGYPEEEFLVSLHPLMRRFFHLNRGELLVPGSRAGGLTREGAAFLGLRENTAVAVSGTDALHPMPAMGLTRSGDLLMSIGTSTCHVMLSEEFRPFPGICGVVRDGIIPGLYGYEAGQSATGDLFDWVVNWMTPPSWAQEAEKKQVSVHTLLTEKASSLLPGESGLLMLDWWNGCRSPLMDSKLTGMILGLTLETGPEEVYRAAIEACAFSTRMIVENFERHGIKVKRVFACGGISRKNPLLMQIYADVLKREIRVADSPQAAALGSAVFAAVAAGREDGGYENVDEAAEHMKCGISAVYTPKSPAGRTYDRIYDQYVRLTKQFGEETGSVMKCLRDLKEEI